MSHDICCEHVTKIIFRHPRAVSGVRIFAAKVKLQPSHCFSSRVMQHYAAEFDSQKYPGILGVGERLFNPQCIYLMLMR